MSYILYDYLMRISRNHAAKVKLTLPEICVFLPSSSDEFLPEVISVRCLVDGAKTRFTNLCLFVFVHFEA